MVLLDALSDFRRNDREDLVAVRRADDDDDDDDDDVVVVGNCVNLSVFAAGSVDVISYDIIWSSILVLMFGVATALAANDDEADIDCD